MIRDVWTTVFVLMGTWLLLANPVRAELVTQLNFSDVNFQFQLTGVPGVPGTVNLGGPLGSLDGTIKMGEFQPPTGATKIVQPLALGDHQFTLFTHPFGGAFPTPSGSVVGNAMTVDLTSLHAAILGPKLNGTLNIGGLATGTFDQGTGKFSISWVHVYDNPLVVLGTSTLELKGTASVVPLPGVALLFASGLASFAGLSRMGHRRAV